MNKMRVNIYIYIFLRQASTLVCLRRICIVLTVDKQKNPSHIPTGTAQTYKQYENNISLANIIHTTTKKNDFTNQTNPPDTTTTTKHHPQSSYRAIFAGNLPLLTHYTPKTIH